MSRKVDLFKTVITQPQPLSSFVVWMPIAPTSAILCTECTLPFESYQEDSININGQQVYYPTRTQVTGAWECTFEEATIPVAAPTVALLKGFTRLGGSLEGTNPDFNKQVKLLFTNNPVSSLRVFTRQTTILPIQDIVVMLLRNDSAFMLESIPSSIKILKAAWLQSVQDISLGASKATEVLKYRLRFRYSAIKDITSDNI